MGNLCSMIDVNDHQEPQQRPEGVVYVNERQHQPYPAERLNMQLANSSDQKRSSHSSSPDRRAMNGNQQQQQQGTPQQGEVRPDTPPEEQWRIATTNAAVDDAQALYDGVEEQLPPQEEPFSWTKGELIGIGAFGRVFSGLNNVTGELIAVKQVSFAKDEALQPRVAEHIRALEAEVEVLKTLKHENIVRYLGTERTEDAIHIFLEYVPGGSIASLLAKFGAFQESVIRVYTRQILKGLEHLHQEGIMHRDVKGANILVDKRGTVKLADFGASKKIEDLATVGSGCKSIRGTPYWMAPEVIKQTGHGRPADIWSVGCTVIEMATGKPPWSNYAAPVAAMFQIASSKDPPPIPEHLSREAKDFLLLCFNRVARDRANATRLLKHPFVANAGREPIPTTFPISSIPAAATASTSTTPPRGVLPQQGAPLAATSLVSPGDGEQLQGHYRQLPGGVARPGLHSALAVAQQSRGSPARRGATDGHSTAATTGAAGASQQYQRGDAGPASTSNRTPQQQRQQQANQQAQLQQQAAQHGQAQHAQHAQHAQQIQQAQQQQQQDVYRHQYGPGGMHAAGGTLQTLVDWNPVTEPSWAPEYNPVPKFNRRRTAYDDGDGELAWPAAAPPPKSASAKHSSAARAEASTANGMPGKGHAAAAAAAGVGARDVELLLDAPRDRSSPVGSGRDSPNKPSQAGAGGTKGSSNHSGSHAEAAVAKQGPMSRAVAARAAAAAATAGTDDSRAGNRGSTYQQQQQQLKQQLGLNGLQQLQQGQQQGGEDHARRSKIAQWENELFEELERHRKEQRITRAGGLAALAMKG